MKSKQGDDAWEVARKRNIYTIKLLRWLMINHYDVWKEWKEIVYETERRN